MKDSQVSGSGGYLEDEVNLIDVWKMLVRQKKWIFGSLLVSFATAWILVLVLPSEWETSAILRVGQVGDMGGSNSKEHLVEPVSNVLQRLSSTDFRDETLAGLNIGNQSFEGSLFFRSFKAAPLAGDLVQLKSRGVSVDRSREMMAYAIDKIVKLHQEIAAPVILASKSRLSEIDGELQAAIRLRDKLSSGLDDSHPSSSFAGGNSGSNVIAIAIQGSEIKDLQQERALLTQQLSQRNTYPTSAFSSVSVSTHPVFPNPYVFFSLAALIGFIAGAFIASVRDRRG